MNIRCVVTGRNSSDKSVFVKDAAVEPVTLPLLLGFEFHRLWGADSIPKLPATARLPLIRATSLQPGDSTSHSSLCLPASAKSQRTPMSPLPSPKSRPSFLAWLKSSNQCTRACTPRRPWISTSSFPAKSIPSSATARKSSSKPAIASFKTAPAAPGKIAPLKIVALLWR